MSHVVSPSAVIITDLECLREALLKFPKLKLRENQRTYHWYGKWMRDYNSGDAAYKNGIDPKDYGKCDHALHMDGVTYEAGVCKRKDGKGYSVVWDFYSDGKCISDYIGDGAEKLMVEYQKALLRKHATTEGLTFEVTNETEEEILVEMEVPEQLW